jgi:hypothetical protein
MLSGLLDVRTATARQAVITAIDLLGMLETSEILTEGKIVMTKLVGFHMHHLWWQS